MTKNYARNKGWRNRNRKKYESAKLRYYRKHSEGRPNKKKPYTLREYQMIHEHSIPDAWLALLLGRSVQGLQNLRNKLKREGFDGKTMPSMPRVA